MMTKMAALRFTAVLFLPLAAAACGGRAGTATYAGTRADPQVAAACRARADSVYSQQNRADLSRRDERDTPFSSSRNSGITSAGLGQLYGRDRMVASCIATSGAPTPDASTGPTLSGPNSVGGSGTMSPSAP